MLKLGLTGGIGSGKSTVGLVLSGLGATIIDSDAISRQITQAGGAAIGAITTQLGADFITADGAMDRDKMRAHVFAHPAARKQLEAIIHPLVQQEAQRQASAADTSQCPLIVFDIPLLVESGVWRKQLDRVLVVDCSPAVQIARVMARSGLQKIEVEKIIASQCTREQRLAAADWVICNINLTLDALAEQVKHFFYHFELSSI